MQKLSSTGVGGNTGERGKSWGLHVVRAEVTVPVVVIGQLSLRCEVVRL